MPGDNISVKALGLSPGTDYTAWIQVNPVNEGDSLVPGEDPSISQESVTTDVNGNILSPLTQIWSIPTEAPATCIEYDIVLDRAGTGNGTYNAADDAIDSANVAGILAPVPELPTIILMGVGLLALAGYVELRRKRFFK